MRISAVLSLAILIHAGVAYASSPDAWDDFRQEVQRKCAAMAEGRIETPAVFVDPFGTESYGVAILTGKAVGADAMVSAVCVYDKESQRAEISGELPADEITITIP